MSFSICASFLVYFFFVVFKVMDDLGEDRTSDSEPDDLAEQHRGSRRDSLRLAVRSRRQKIDAERASRHDLDRPRLGI